MIWILVSRKQIWFIEAPGIRFHWRDGRLTRASRMCEWESVDVAETMPYAVYCVAWSADYEQFRLNCDCVAAQNHLNQFTLRKLNWAMCSSRNICSAITWLAQLKYVNSVVVWGREWARILQNAWFIDQSTPTKKKKNSKRFNLQYFRYARLQRVVINRLIWFFISHFEIHSSNWCEFRVEQR